MHLPISRMRTYFQLLNLRVQASFIVLGLRTRFPKIALEGMRIFPLT